MNTDIEFIKKNIADYEISRNIVGWTVSEIGGDISMFIDRDTAFELLALLDKKNWEDDEKEKQAL